MAYMSTKEAADKWDLNVQRVAYYAASGRIPGAVKTDNRWRIPTEASKPLKNHFPACGLHAFSTITFIPGEAERTIAVIKDEMLREQLWAEMCYLRGDFIEAEQHLKRVKRSQRKDLIVAAWFHTIQTAFHLTNHGNIIQGIERLQEIKKECCKCGNLWGKKAAELALDTFYTAINMPEQCHEWIKCGELSELPYCLKIDAAYTRCMYLQSSGRLLEMMAEYRMVSAFVGDNPFWRGYPAVMAVLAYSSAQEAKKADKLAVSVCHTLLADGLIVPIADYICHAGHLFFKHIESTSHNYNPKLRQLCSDHFRCMIEAVKLVTGKEISYNLTLREAETVYFASKGLTNKEIAVQLKVSVNTVKLRLQTAYEKLHIHSRKELCSFIFLG